MTELSTYLDTAVAMAQDAAGLARSGWVAAGKVDYKADGSAITPTDLEIEEMWRDRLRRAFPDHGILGEEFGHDAGRSAFTWVLDPIDGTRQFAGGGLNFATLISLCRDEVPVLGIIDLPLVGARYIGVEGQATTWAGHPVRTRGRATLGDAVIGLANPDSFTGPTASGYACLRGQGRLRLFDTGSPAYGALARGRLDVCLNGPDLDAFDICALCPVVTGAGGVISDWNSGALGLASKGAIVASASAALHAEVVAALRAAVSD